MKDGNIFNDLVGYVVEVFYGNFGDFLIGLDVVVVRNYMYRLEGIFF